MKETNFSQMFKKISLAFLFFSFLILSMSFFTNYNQGFSLKKITTDLPDSGIWEMSPTSCTEPIVKILDQPYKFLGRGGQVFAFVSEDENYVIKIIRYDLLTPTLLMRLKGYFFKDSFAYIRKNKRYNEAMQSYYNSHNDLSDVTNILYTHLVKQKGLQKKIALKDRLGKTYSIDLNSIGFVLQKKARLLGHVLLDLKKTNDNKRICEILEEYLCLLKNRSDKGFWIKDHNQSLNNYGFIDGKLFEIDVGSYRLKNDKDSAFIKKNNLDHLKRLHLWIRDNVNECLGFFDTKINEIIIEN